MGDRRYGLIRLNIGLRHQPRKTSRHRLPRNEPKQNRDQPQIEPRRLSVYNSTSFPLFSRQSADNELVAENAMSRKNHSLRHLNTTGQSRTHQRQLSLHLSHNGSDSEDANGPTPVEESSTRCSRLTLASVSDNDSLNSLVLLPPRPPSATSRNLRNVRTTTRSRKNSGKNMSFSFQLLPYVCQLKVFSYLSSLEKGRLFLVCKCWYDLLRSCCLWSHVSCCEIQMHCVTKEHHNCLEVCYAHYCHRVHQFLDFLRDIHPVLHNLEFKFDIADTNDGFLFKLEQLIQSANTHNLKYVSMNWKSTPVRPFWLDRSILKSKCDEVIQKHRHRQRLFVNFFYHFTLFSPNITTLILPFDWSERSVESLLRLKHLHNLVLEKYFVFQYLSQALLDKLLSGLLNLKRLMLEVWTPCGQGLVMFSITSRSLEYLDISQCRGFYLQHLNTPRLTQFHVARHPWNGPLVIAEHLNIPCLYDILLDGAPDLVKLNDHYLQSNWLEIKYSQLQEILRGICSCRHHKTGWAM